LWGKLWNQAELFTQNVASKFQITQTLGLFMDTRNVKVKFEPQGKSVEVARGATVRDAAVQAGINLDYPCGGNGTCGKCKVRLLSNDGVLTPAEEKALSPDEVARGTRLACQVTVQGSLTVEIPEESLQGAAYKILEGPAAEATAPVDPPVTKRYIELSQPTMEDALPDLERLCQAVGASSVDSLFLGELPRLLREDNFRGTAVLAGDTLIGFETGNTEDECFALAFDIGTTTLAGELLDLRTGTVRAFASCMNPQTSYGDDVLSRIAHASAGPDSLGDLHGQIIAAVNEMIAEMSREAGVGGGRMYGVAFAGNTTMQHLLTNLDPSALGMVPFVPVLARGFEIPAAQLGLDIHPRAQVFIHPVIGGFVGGDTVADLAVTHLDECGGPALLVDIGTNGEIVLFNKGVLSAASCAAGPAFEGARISCGMRAAAGAIEEVEFNHDLRISVIGGGPPTGLCGSGLIDLAAELLRVGMLLSQGMLLSPDALEPGVPDSLRERLVDTDEGPAFTIATAAESGTGAPLLLTQRDVRELQLATGAIRAGIAILLRREGLDVGDLERLCVAGGFGNYVDLANAQRIGLLPEGVDPARFDFVGNAALAGARAAAVSQKARAQADVFARSTAHIELSLDPDFQTEFAMAMFFPEAEATV
jgi:uncharacterized 2Fe-2S/4Fe-4S cluster protein (DUF4445 family)